MARLDFKLNGEDISVDTEELLVITNPDVERSMVAAEIAHWGMVLASAEGNLARLEARQENWYGKQVVAELERDAKLSEWKAKEKVKSDDAYIRWADQAAGAKELADKVRAVHTALMKKHDMLKAMADRERGTPSSNIGRERNPSEPDPRFNNFRNKRSGR